MVELTEIQTNIQNLLMQAIRDSNSQEVQNIFDNNEHNDIQAALSHDEALTGGKGTILDFAITCFNIAGEAQVEIIKLIWEEADQKTRDFLCDYKVANFFGDQPYFTDTIDNLKRLQQKIDPNNTDIYPVLAQVVQEMEEHKKVINLDFNAPIVTNTTAPITGNTTPENNDNDTTFLSKHKGKIALSVGGLCVAGAIAAYVLAYPVVALVLAVSALAVLAGAYIGGVFEYLFRRMANVQILKQKFQCFLSCHPSA